MKYLVILASLLCTALSSQVDCPDEVKNCTCLSNQVTCSLRKYLSMPEHMTFVPNTRFFYFDENFITVIKSTHFKHCVSMTYLSLRENKITTVHEDSFENNIHLITIDMSHNSITYLGPKLFQRLTKLTQLYLGFNKLKRIETDHFTHLATLTIVRMNNNDLEHIGKDAFINSRGLMELYLETNKLEIPEKNWLVSFNTTAMEYAVYLDGNPWSCDCRMKEFFLWANDHPWFKKHDSDGVSVPTCHTPESLAGTSLAKIPDVDELRCTDVIITSTVRTVTATAGEHIDIQCNATGFPLPKVTITNSAGKEINSSRGSTIYHLDEVTLDHSGVYTCNASGINKNQISQWRTETIRLYINRTPGNIAAIVFVSLIISVCGIVIIAYLYKKKFSDKSAYGRLPNSGSAYYDSSAVTASAKYNADSMRDSDGPPAPSRVENPYLRDSDSDGDDDRVVEYAKDTEFLV